MESARVVLVTNVGQGFGRAVALAYGRAGYDVVCADRDVEMAAKTAAEVEELGGQAIPIQADMTTQMDVLAAYQKVTEIFGALGGVVHLAGQVSTTPFEELAEGEFYEVMAENVRSTFLALKTAARLLNNGWVVIVAPPTAGSVQMHAVQGALRELVGGFRRRFAYPRVNLVLPSRTPSDPRHDQALVRAVRFLGSPEAAGVSGQVVDVDLPTPPRLAEALLPEVRAALDPTVRQSESDDWDDSSDPDEPFEDEAADSVLLAPGVRLRRRGPVRRYPAGVANHVWTAPAEESAAEGYEGGALTYDEFDDDESDDWAYDLGLPEGPALRHLVEGEGELLGEEPFAASHESALDLYGDLSSLRVGEDDDGDLPGPRRG